MTETVAAGASDGADIVIEFKLSNQISISHKSKRQCCSKRVLNLCHRIRTFLLCFFVVSSILIEIDRPHWRITKDDHQLVL